VVSVAGELANNNNNNDNNHNYNNNNNNYYDNYYYYYFKCPFFIARLRGWTIGESRAMSIYLRRLLLAAGCCGRQFVAVQAETPRHSTTQPSPGQVQTASVGERRLPAFSGVWGRGRMDEMDHGNCEL
jgi:hypothetical protein